MTRPCSQRALLTTSVAIVLALVLAACGSNLDPNEVRAGSGGTTVQNGVAVDGSAASEGDTGLDDSGLGLGDTSGGDTSGGGDPGGREPEPQRPGVERDLQPGLTVTKPRLKKSNLALQAA